MVREASFTKMHRSKASLWTFAFLLSSLFPRVSRLDYRSTTYRPSLPREMITICLYNAAIFFLPHSRLISSAKPPLKQISGSWLSSHNTHIILKTRSSRGSRRRKRCGANGQGGKREKVANAVSLERGKKGSNSNEAQWRSRCSHGPISEILCGTRGREGETLCAFNYLSSKYSSGGF